MGAELLYLPPYSLRSELHRKGLGQAQATLLRAAKARTKEALDQAIAEALKLISADNAKAWFRHCKYGLTVKREML